MLPVSGMHNSSFFYTSCFGSAAGIHQELLFMSTKHKPFCSHLDEHTELDSDLQPPVAGFSDRLLDPPQYKIHVLNHCMLSMLRNTLLPCGTCSLLYTIY